MSTSEKLKVGVLGTGALGRHHARLYKMIENAELVGIFDVSEENARKVGEEFDIEVYTDMMELVDKCDAMSVAVPAHFHHQVTIPVLKKGVHVLVEKPIAATVSEAEEMVAVAAEQNLVLGVGHVERFNPAMDFLEQHAMETRFAEVHRLATYPPARPGQHRRGTEVSVVLDLMIHDLDLILTMFGSEIERVDAVGIPVMSDTEDIASVRIKFKNGGVANLTASRVSLEPQRRFRVFLPDCYVSMDYGNHTGMAVRKTKVGLAKKDISLSEKNALEHELRNFVDAVIQTRDSGSLVKAKVCGDQGLRALKLAVQVSDEIQSYNDRYDIKFA
ncbi:MAG: Gfo/Idh/MocA family oxidoreductase [Victivallales bacterium]|nr:Gfo/Idh/MocA family oxidoreductase [Victivallales bacterium]